MHDHDEMPIVAKSYLRWYLDSTGVPTLLVLFGAMLLALVLIVTLFRRGRGPAVPTAIVFIMPLPLVVGLVCFLAGTIHYLHQMGLAAGEQVSSESLSYALTSAMQATSCFCPVLILSLVLLMVLGFRNQTKS
ncbi:hypothetical protein [Anatilimnocola floriformis]|uniref:hypothetical protein n=1 Tax=Anatilimnocola floriformis TaxID=2948575 RepID=UPI0020C459FD|nr:hypothetical protein [Anatilimnocola floriformis]